MAIFLYLTEIKKYKEISGDYIKNKLIENNFEIRAYTLDEANMKNKYTVNNIFNNDGIPFTDLVAKIFTSFLDEDLELQENDDTIISDIVQNL